MPRDGQGVFSRTNGTFSGPTTWAQQAASASNEINSGRHDTHDEDIAQALTGSLPRDGQAAMTGPLPMGGQRITNLGAPIDNFDGARYGITPTGRSIIRNLATQATLAGHVFDSRDPGYGAVFDGVQDAGAGINAAIQAAKAAGGGIVLVGPGTGIIEQTLVLPNGVYLVGHGMVATTLKAKNGLNAAVIQSEGFATLTGTNMWFVSEGVQHDIGLFDFSIDGNKANQTAGRGIELYAKKLKAFNVFIRDCFSDGWYSEAGDKGGQTDWRDNPETDIRYVFSRNNGGHGFLIRGPHDARYDGLYANDNDGWGLRIEISPNVYRGQCYIGKVHLYSNTAGNLYWNTAWHGEMIIAENSFGQGVVGDGWGARISKLELYSNNRSTGTEQLELTTLCQRTWIGSLEISQFSTASANGAHIKGARNHIEDVLIVGNSGVSTGSGLIIDGSANYTKINGGTITLFNAVGGVGIVTNATSGSSVGLQIFGLEISDCATIWSNPNEGAYNFIQMHLDAKTGQTLFSGQPPGQTKTENWQVSGTDAAGVRKLTHERSFSTENVDMNSATVQTVTAPLNMLVTPRIEDIQATLYFSGANNAFRYSGPWINSITADTVTAKIAITTPTGVPATGKVVFDVRV